MKIIDGKSPAVFKKYRKELNEVIKGTLYNYVKDAFRIQLNKFTTDDIVSKRDSIENAIERYLTQALAKENFQLEQLTSGLKYPQTIVESVNAKNKAIQMGRFLQSLRILANDVGYCYIDNHLDIEYLKRYSC